MASTDARPIPQKNVAYRLTFPILDADGDLVTAAGSLDSEISKDGGTFTDCTNEDTEIATASGMYYLDLTSTEMNADTVAVIVKSTGGKTTPIVMYPEEAGDVRVNVTQVAGTTQTAGDLAALINTVDDFLDTEVAAIKAKTDNLPSDPADASDIASSFATVNTKLDTIDDFLDTEVAAIKAKTDALPASPAAVGSAMTLAADAVTAAVLAADAVAEIQNGLSTLTAAGVRSAVGLASANLDTQLGAIDDLLDTEVAAIKAKTDQLNFTGTDVKATLDGELVTLAASQLAVKKNTALTAFEFVMLDSSGVPATGLSVTAQRSLDGGAFGACANSVVEVGSGVYKITLAAADLNADTVMLKFSAASNKTTFVKILPQS